MNNVSVNNCTFGNDAVKQICLHQVSFARRSKNGAGGRGLQGVGQSVVGIHEHFARTFPT